MLHSSIWTAKQIQRLVNTRWEGDNGLFSTKLTIGFALKTEARYRVTTLLQEGVSDAAFVLCLPLLKIFHKSGNVRAKNISCENISLAKQSSPLASIHIPKRNILNPM